MPKLFIVDPNAFSAFSMQFMHIRPFPARAAFMDISGSAFNQISSYGQYLNKYKCLPFPHFFVILILYALNALKNICLLEILVPKAFVNQTNIFYSSCIKCKSPCSSRNSSTESVSCSLGFSLIQHKC